MEAWGGGGFGEGGALAEDAATPRDGGSQEGEVGSRVRRVEQEKAEALVLAARREGRGPEGDAAARKAESDRALAQVVGLARGVEEVGARLTFTFWVEEGALTPLGYREERGGGRAGRAVGAEGLERMLRPVFTEYMGRRMGEVVLTLRREEACWAVDYDATHQGARPPEAKTLPVRTRGTTADSLRALYEGARKALDAVWVPAGGAARVELAVRLEDGRPVGWEWVEARHTREGPGGVARALSPEVVGHTVQVLLPFTEGLGPRMVHLVVRAEHRPAEARAWGRVESVRVERPPSAFALTPEQGWYHAMHEAILLRWREDVYEGTAWLSQRGVEEAALWVAGGVIAKGVGFFGTKGLEWVPRALSRGPEAAAGWLRSALKRLPEVERERFEQLWRKVALEGEEALTRAERETLRSLFARIELVIQQPLGKTLKSSLRTEARKYYARLYPQFAESLDALADELPIHHRCPLQYAHLFPAEDINAGKNLAMLRRLVHQDINILWEKFRQARPKPTADEVRRAAEIIDRNFEPWYHRIDEPPGLLKTAEEAREAALRELRSQFPGLE
ncbi:hypothetical protein [Archangium sp.]|uniref:hypothetical protein n=1 Tax=Archangium sp. TaxID=1872627 RepID=UPI00286C5293|nr:hypothetical protein [Archangium sp.]